MTPDLDAIAKLRKAALDKQTDPPFLSAQQARFIQSCYAFDFDALQSRLAALEGALVGHDPRSHPDAYDEAALHRPDTRAGHRSGIEVGWMTFERYRAMLAEHGLRPFHREPWVNPRTGKVEPGVLGERPAMRWRVSRDEWDRLREYVELVTGPYTHASERMQAQLFGWPIDPDDVLPPNSIIFEPA